MNINNTESHIVHLADKGVTLFIRDNGKVYQVSDDTKRAPKQVQVEINKGLRRFMFPEL